MEDEHREAIRRNISSLVNQTDLEIMRSALYEKGIFTEHNMETYTDISSTQTHRKRCMYNDIMRRGPNAFGTLLETLEENGYWDLVRMLDPNSILNTFSNANTRSQTTEKGNKYVSLGDTRQRVKSENELNNHPAPVHGVMPPAAAAANNNQPFVVNKSDKFIEDNKSNELQLYRTRGRQRGVMLAFTYINFKNNIEKYRAGAELDSAHLKYLFSEIGLKANAYQDLTLQETKNTLESLDAVLTPGLESVFIVVSSHGYERRGSHDTDIRCSDGQLISLLDIVSYFSNRRLPHLRNVPKVFIFQICRGSNEDFVYSGSPPPPHLVLAESDGTPVPPDGRAPPAPREAPAANSKKVALYTNILLVQSTLPGFVSHRDPARGSWYIQALCETFAARAHDCHVDLLFTMVDKRLKELFEIQTSSVDRWGFNRLLYLHPGLHE